MLSKPSRRSLFLVLTTSSMARSLLSISFLLVNSSSVNSFALVNSVFFCSSNFLCSAIASLNSLLLSASEPIKISPVAIRLFTSSNWPSNCSISFLIPFISASILSCIFFFFSSKSLEKFSLIRFKFSCASSISFSSEANSLWVLPLKAL